MRAIYILALPFVFACARQEAPPSWGRAGLAASRSGEAPVAHVAGRSILGRDIAHEAVRAGVDVTTALNRRIAFELLALAAEERVTEPLAGEEQEAIRGAKVERFISEVIEPQLRMEAIDVAEVRAFYDRIRKRFVHGRLVQVAVLCVFTGARMKPEARARAARNSALLRDELAARNPITRESFLAIANDPVWVERQVSSTTVWQDRDEPFPKVLGEAVQRLSRPGDMTALLGDETGFYVALYLAERPAENITFEQASPTLRAEMFDPWRRHRFSQLSVDLASTHDIAIAPENLGPP